MEKRIQEGLDQSVREQPICSSTDSSYEPVDVLSYSRPLFESKSLCHADMECRL